MSNIVHIVHQHEIYLNNLSLLQRYSRARLDFTFAQVTRSSGSSHSLSVGILSMGGMRVVSFELLQNNTHLSESAATNGYIDCNVKEIQTFLYQLFSNSIKDKYFFKVVKRFLADRYGRRRTGRTRWTLFVGLLPCFLLRVVSRQPLCSGHLTFTITMQQCSPIFTLMYRTQSLHLEFGRLSNKTFTDRRFGQQQSLKLPLPNSCREY